MYKNLRGRCQRLHSVITSLHASSVALLYARLPSFMRALQPFPRQCPYRKHFTRWSFIWHAKYLSLCAGRVAAPDLATMDAQRVRELTDPPPEPSATPHPGSQQELDNTPAGHPPLLSVKAVTVTVVW